MVRRGDVLLALGIALLSWLATTLAEQAVSTASHTSSTWEVLRMFLTLEALALVWWRKHPLLTLGLIFLLHIPVLLLPLNIALTDTVFSGMVEVNDIPANGVAQTIAAFSIGRRLALPRATAILTSLATLAVLITVVVKQPNWPTIIAVMIVNALQYLAPMLVGAMLASRARHEQIVRRLKAEEQEKRLTMALLEERRRLASELHDVAAHHLAGLVVQAAALERLIDRDPDRAKDAAKQLRSMGKEALTGLRSVVKLLRHDDPQRGLADIPALIESTRALGVPITADLTLPASLPPLSETAAYRIIQQAISNAIQHAPGAPLHVEITPEGLTVSNGRGQGEVGLGSGGVGLEVMQERAAAIGAEFRAGPTDAGGWQVQLTWPHPIEEET
ncbi:MAG: histidine kinase [Arachnia propionica]|uniref:sensor histidine kinase n=1 Tax=Arachnia propionica TaxID=1750 RepID=UPI0027024581|nr:histidine kinase [Arachnia propionica]